VQKDWRYVTHIRRFFMAGHDDHDLLTVSEVAQQLRVDDTTVRRWIKNGVLEAVTLPHVGQRQSYRVRRKTLDLLLNPAVTA
jgi:excisionase family DNA binding protein